MGYVTKTTQGMMEILPIIGGWYVGFDTRKDAKTGEEWERDGAIAQYVGNGEFYEEDHDFPTDMRSYEYIGFSHVSEVK